MHLPVVGPAWPEEHDALRVMAQVLEVAVRFQGLRGPTPGAVEGGRGRRTFL